MNRMMSRMYCARIKTSRRPIPPFISLLLYYVFIKGFVSGMKQKRGSINGERRGRNETGRLSKHGSSGIVLDSICAPESVPVFIVYICSCV